MPSSGPGTAPQARILEGDLFNEEVQGAEGSPAPLAGLPRFASCEFETTYPFARVLLTDPHFPLQASVEVFNPFVPGDEEMSSLPIAIVRVTLESLVDNALECSVMLSAEALLGHACRRQGLPSRPVATAALRAGDRWLSAVLMKLWAGTSRSQAPLRRRSWARVRGPGRAGA